MGVSNEFKMGRISVYFGNSGALWSGYFELANPSFIKVTRSLTSWGLNLSGKISSSRNSVCLIILKRRISSTMMGQ